MALTAGWIAINLVFPAVVSPFVMFLAHHFLATTPAQLSNTAFLPSVQKGQLGWLAIAWSSSAIFKTWGSLETNSPLYHFSVIISSAGAITIVTCLFVAVGGAMTSSSTVPAQKKYAYTSMFLTGVAGTLLAFAQLKTGSLK